MDLTQIRYFLALAKTLNFTRAAEACNVTQPALTKSIQRLEEEFGGQLLLRERSNTQLTELGRAIHPLLQQTFDAATAARQGALQFRQQEVARLRIGLGDGVAPGTIMPLIREISRRFPTLEVTIRNGSTGELNKWLTAAEIDVALTTDAARLGERVNQWPVFTDRVVAWLPAAHPLAARDPLPADLLKEEVMIGRVETADGQVREPLELARPRHRGGSDGVISDMVRAGLGIALSVGRSDVAADLVSRPLDPAHLVEVSVAIPAGRPAPRVAGAFMRLARARDWAA